MHVSIKLNSEIFNDAARRQTVANFVSRQAKDFKSLTKQRMQESIPTGRLYRRRRGATFIRSHRASARGQRPAIDTGTLLNSVKDARINDTTATVTAEAPYARHLQGARLNRPIISPQDAYTAQQKANLAAIAMLDRFR